jgi:hypothetical protein
MVALLPIPFKFSNNPQKRLIEQQRTDRDVLNTKTAVVTPASHR